MSRVRMMLGVLVLLTVTWMVAALESPDFYRQKTQRYLDAYKAYIQAKVNNDPTTPAKLKAYVDAYTDYLRALKQAGLDPADPEGSYRRLQPPVAPPPGTDPPEPGTGSGSGTGGGRDNSPPPPPGFGGGSGTGGGKGNPYGGGAQKGPTDPENKVIDPGQGVGLPGESDELPPSSGTGTGSGTGGGPGDNPPAEPPGTGSGTSGGAGETPPPYPPTGGRASTGSDAGGNDTVTGDPGIPTPRDTDPGTGQATSEGNPARSLEESRTKTGIGSRIDPPEPAQPSQSRDESGGKSLDVINFDL